MSAVNWILLGVVLALLILLYVSRRRTATAATQVSQPASSSRRPMPGASVNRRMNWLQGMSGVAQGRAYHVGSRALTIGRQVGNYIQVLDDEVSRVHARLRGTPDGIQVIDESQSGTYVNGERLISGITETLRDGDELRVGKTKFVMLARASGLRDATLTERKVGGAIGGESTIALEAPDWRSQVAAALLKGGGDVDRAAAEMGMPREAFERMMEAANERP